MLTKLVDGARWGNWVFHANNLTLFCDAGSYEIDLEQITDSAAMLDWIFQLRIKPWVTNDIIGDLITAFENIFRPQGTLCGQGINRKLDATAFLKKRLEESNT
jgi:hypothetical protein